MLLSIWSLEATSEGGKVWLTNSLRSLAGAT
jgi:hypothetical protein